MNEPAETLLPDYLAPALDIVIVGAAPSFAAASIGHYYAGGRNRFWLLLHQAGFTPRQLDPEEDATVLDYGIGLTAILPAHISTDNSRLPPPSDDERTELLRKLHFYRPRFVCYNGRDVCRMVFGEEPEGWGLQSQLLGESRQFVVHSSSGRVDRWGADRLFLWRELKRLVDES